MQLDTRFHYLKPSPQKEQENETHTFCLVSSWSELTFAFVGPSSSLDELSCTSTFTRILARLDDEGDSLCLGWGAERVSLLFSHTLVRRVLRSTVRARLDSISGSERLKRGARHPSRSSSTKWHCHTHTSLTLVFCSSRSKLKHSIYVTEAN